MADAWIFNRESRKSWLREWFAYAHSFFDLMGTHPFTEADSTYFSKIRSIADEEKDEPVIDLVSFQQEAEKPVAPADTAQPPAPVPSAPASDSIPNNLK